jgi:hypothetical protein
MANPNDRQSSRSRKSGLTDLIHHEHAQTRPMAGTIHLNETELEADPAETREIEQGTDVLCRDGDKVGEVVDILPGYLVVEQGFFDPRDIYLPISLVTDHDEASLTIGMTREEFEQRDWSREPAPGEPIEDAPER